MIEYSDEALNALLHIRADRRFGPDQAIRMARRIVSRCNQLDASPHGGHRGRMANTFEVFVSPFVVVFEVEPGRIKILNIWHGRQSRDD
jgi:plasmid stabilization system protein ParE